MTPEQEAEEIVRRLSMTPDEYFNYQLDQLFQIVIADEAKRMANWVDGRTLKKLYYEARLKRTAK